MERAILQLLMEILEIKEDEYKADRELAFMQEWDSYNIIMLITILQDKYNLKMSLEDLNSFETLGDVYKWVETHLKENVMGEYNV